jgi:hypothetical protein
MSAITDARVSVGEKPDGRPGLCHDPEKSDEGPQTKPELSSGDDTPLDVPAVRLQRWNESNINIYRFVVANFSFIIMGMNDGSLGVSAAQRSICITYESVLTSRYQALLPYVRI